MVLILVLIILINLKIQDTLQSMKKKRLDMFKVKWFNILGHISFNQVLHLQSHCLHVVLNQEPLLPYKAIILQNTLWPLWVLFAQTAFFQTNILPTHLKHALNKFNIQSQKLSFVTVGRH